MTIFLTGDNSPKAANTVLTATDFFIENNPDGYFAKSEFISYAQSLRAKEPKDFIGFIDQLKNRKKFDANLTIRNDRGGRPYAFPTFFLANAVKGYKIPMNAPMERFIDDYAEGKITVDFTAMDLEKVALHS